MRRFWVFLGRRVLPVWAREGLLEQIRMLEEENRRLRDVIGQKDAYIRGLKYGMKRSKRKEEEN